MSGGGGSSSIIITTTGTVEVAPTFEISARDGNVSPGTLILQFKSLSSSVGSSGGAGREVRVRVTKLLLKLDGREAYDVEVKDLKINSGGGCVERIDLDPLETREYTIRTHCPNPFDYELSASDETGYEVIFRGRNRSGIPLELMPKATEQRLDDAHISLDRIVRFDPTGSDYTFYYSKLPKGTLRTLRISPGSGASTSFGIFDLRRDSYVELGSGGYKTLVGRYTTRLEWDRDTAASPPSDLTAVHVTDVDDANKQGWVWKTDLLYGN